MEFSNFERDCFSPGKPDSTAYELGKRRVALRIMAFTGMNIGQMNEIIRKESE